MVQSKSSVSAEIEVLRLRQVSGGVPGGRGGRQYLFYVRVFLGRLCMLHRHTHTYRVSSFILPGATL